MSFAVSPQPDACRAWMPTTPLPPSMSPPSPPMVCHMPEGHDGPHSNDRRPTTLSRRWEGDARPPKPVTAPVPPEQARDGRGGVTVIGPECFGDDKVICWRGVNYYADGPLGRRMWPIFRHPIRVIRAIVADYALAKQWSERTGARP